MMIPDLQASLLCDDVRQERNGKFLLIGLFDGLAVREFPARFQKICVVNRWCCGEGDFRQRTRLLAPDGEVVAEGREVAIHLENTLQTATNVEIFMNIPIKTEGSYWVEILLGSELKMRYPLAIRPLPQRAPDAQ